MIAFVTPEKRALAASLQRSLRLVGKSAGPSQTWWTAMTLLPKGELRLARERKRRRGRGLPRPNRSHHGEAATRSVRGANPQGHRGRTSAGRRRKP